MSFWYLGSPYSDYPDGHDAAYREVCKAAAFLAKHGIPVFSPIAHSHSLVEHSDLPAVDHDLWMTVDEPFVKTSYGLIVLKLAGWNESKGLRQEIADFGEAQKPIVYMDWPT